MLNFYVKTENGPPNDMNENQIHRYAVNREGAGEICHPYLQRFEKSILVGQASIREAIKLNQSGYYPDLIIGHSGFGSTMYLKELWPTAKFIGYFEWFYRSSGSDVNYGVKIQLHQILHVGFIHTMHQY